MYPLPCDRIYFDNSFNCRGQFTLDSVKALAENIEERGLDIPIVVQPSEDVPGGVPAGYDWRIVAGHRRFRAVTFFLKWTEIPGSIRVGMDAHAAQVFNFTENLERKDLNPLEEALTLQKLYPEGVTIAKACRDLRKSNTWVAQRLMALKVPNEVRELLAAERVFLYDLQIVLKETTPEGQIRVANEIAASKRGRGRNRVFRANKYVRQYRRRLNKADMNKLIEEIISSGIDNELATRAIACCAGYISIEELQEDIEREASLL